MAIFSRILNHIPKEIKKVVSNYNFSNPDIGNWESVPRFILSRNRHVNFCSLAVIICFLSASVSKSEELYGAPPKGIHDHLNRLVMSYPKQIERHDGKFLYLKDGRKFEISDGRMDKTFASLLESPDIDDMFYAEYPEGKPPARPPLNFDPGRVRYEALFVAMYGDCMKNEVRGRLRAVPWLPRHGGRNVTVTTINGVADALEAVSKELDELPERFTPYLLPSAGTYNCRMIAGTNTRSMHAYAGAIDANTKFSHYWRWAATSGREPEWQNQFPVEIVRIFEKHCFIWGGRWYHFDTMHFEYRPELLPSCSIQTHK